MTIGDSGTPYGEAWERLFQLLLRRSNLLRHLELMVSLTKEGTPAAGMVIEFDTPLARQLLDELDTLTPLISAEIEEVNKYGERIGKPQIKWRKLYLSDD